MSKRTVSHEGFIFQRLYSTVPNGTTLNLWCTLLTCSLSTCHQLPPLADLSHTDKIVPTHTHSYCIVSWGAIMRASTHTHTSASVCVCVCVSVCNSEPNSQLSQSKVESKPSETKWNENIERALWRRDRTLSTLSRCSYLI